MKVSELDFTDDRLTLLLRRLSKPATWQVIETDLGRNLLRVYDLKPKQVRLDSTTVSGYHAGGEDSLFEFGHSKDDPTLRQVKVMVAALDPLGLPLVSQVVAGSIADGPLYIPAVDRVLQIIDGVGLLFVGDSKMSALATRAHIHRLNQHYLCPLALTGKTAEEMSGWIEVANSADCSLRPVSIENDQGERKQLAEGYGFERTVSAEIVSDPKHPEQKEVQKWTEQVFVVCTVRYQITAVVRQEEAIAALQKTFGWRAYVTDAPAKQLTLEQAVLTYRDEWLIEHGFHRLKGAPVSLDPLFVKRDDQVVGLTNYP